MERTGQGASAPSVEHTASPDGNRPPKNTAATPYLSGFCATGYHERCLGDFRTALCSCEHHTAPPPAPVRIATVRCFFGCSACVACEDPQQAQAAMEAHYRTSHWGDIAAALWAAS